MPQAVRRRATSETYYAAVGCAACNRSGYHGRTGIYELLTVDDDLRRLVHDRASEQALRAHVRRARHELAARGRHALGRGRA